MMRMIVQNNIVVVEGSVLCAKKDGALLDALFCDVFEMERGKIKRLAYYLIDKATKNI